MQKSTSHKKTRVLIAPLDWGMGHTTRCVPIITTLLGLGTEVVLAGNEFQKKIWEKEFPQCKFLTLKGYNISYSKYKILFALKILLQIPKILTAIQQEKKWLQQVLTSEKIDAVISDNRYGLYSSLAPSVFITHQLKIKNQVKFIENLIQKINYHFIKKFDYCWIPDTDQNINLSGILGHPKTLPQTTVQYIGLLSRLKKTDVPPTKNIVFLLSGPEPQRTLLENKIVAALNNATHSQFILIRGLPQNSIPLSVPANVEVYNYLSSDQLNQVLNTARYIICRSGYSSVMDLALLQKKAILIPTPGQTEQEYLATHLDSIGFAPHYQQSEFELNKIISLASTYQYKTIAFNDSRLKEVSSKWIQQITAHQA